MANRNDSKVVLGEIAKGGFETVGRSLSWAEQKIITANIVGQPNDIFNKAKPGDSAGKFPLWFANSGLGGNYFVRTVEELNEDGVSASVKLSLVYCPSGKTKPYNVSWDIGMEEVQMRLINHPDILANAAIDHLNMWEDTPKWQRVKKNDKGQYEFYYRSTWAASMGTWTLSLVENEWEKAYCRAVTMGIETYNKYLPTITKTSTYLEMPGARYNEVHNVVGGTITDFTGSNQIGKYNAPDLKVAGYIDRKDGVWFKNCDKYTINADGTATRTEGWVFTNDPTHMWIYTGQLNN